MSERDVSVDRGETADPASIAVPMLLPTVDKAPLPRSTRHMRRAPVPPASEPEPVAAVGPAATVTAPARVSLGESVRELTSAEFEIVHELRSRVSTRLTHEEGNFAPEDRRELTRHLIRDEYDLWVVQEAHRGRQAPEPVIESQIFAAVMADLDGLGRLAPLLSRSDIEDIHFDGSAPTVLRLADGSLVEGPPIASTDSELVQLLRSIAASTEDGQTSREFSSATPVLNVRMKGVSDLGARLAAAMDVVPRPSGVIRVHRMADSNLTDLRRAGMIDSAMHALLHAAVTSGTVSMLVTGTTGVGKTTLLRALGSTIPYSNVVVTVEDERELGLHLPRWDSESGRSVSRHAVTRSFESRLANSEGRGAFGMSDALHEALRASPTWVIVGEVRGGYVMNLLEAVTSGISAVMCTIHSPTAAGIFDKVLINAQKLTPPPSESLVLRSLSSIDLVVHVERDRNYHRHVSGIYELGPVGDDGLPSRTAIFERRADGRGVPTGSGMLSPGLREALVDGGGLDLRWLDPASSNWGAPDAGERAS